MWKRNTAIAFAGLTFVGIYLFRLSAQLERRYNPGPMPVPSQAWAAHTLEDDPHYYEKVEKKRNGPSFFQRIFQNKDDFVEE